MSGYLSEAPMVDKYIRPNLYKYISEYMLISSIDIHYSVMDLFLFCLKL